jgi:4a-hydroxytetrahydrobiopterin dehydratase
MEAFGDAMVGGDFQIVLMRDNTQVGDAFQRSIGGSVVRDENVVFLVAEAHDVDQHPQMSRPRKLSPEEVSQALPALDGWSLVEGKAIARSYGFSSYSASIEFVVAVAREAEEMNHHPDLHIGWRKVEAVLCTHSAGGITELDLTLAQRMNALHQAATI